MNRPGSAGLPMLASPVQIKVKEEYLLLPPGYAGAVPEGYFVARPRTIGNLLFFRTFLKDGDPKPGVDNVKKNLKVYSLSQTANQPPMKFVDISGKAFNTIGPG